ncbi:uncharacterized protein SPSC_05558 [Sporisorium scitamineum]|uniref:Endoplasmic reticulum junction formation protein lunapark n=1 Tax=Sporisorium scitamineum TaxID=49012 RepID=A0A0F7S0F2_9BASI|nr:uncharacterized protein SPSC_05558 [Sporisorium scitamineum]CDS00754.1 hypothetical protein [Sporisorium scitamineum]
MGVFNALVSGSFLPWKRSNRETDYETVLSQLEGEIQDVQSRLTQIRLRERRASVTLTLQAFLLWAVYTFVCWFFGLLSLRRPRHYDPDAGWKTTRMLGVWVPVVGSPVLIISTRRIVRWWYRRIGAAEDKHLIDLKRQKREKIDEIKRATKYDHLRMLLEKYDEAGPKGGILPAASTPQKGKPGSKAGSPTSKDASSSSPASTGSVNSTPQRPGAVPAVPAPTTPEAQALQAQRMALMRQQGNVLQPPRSMPAAPMLPMQKTWMDKLADAILGADPSATGPEQKYALICARCHAHNGLALKIEFNEVQYICPHCGHFNSRRPSSVPVSSPFNSNTSGAAGIRARVSDQGLSQAVETPSKPSRTERGSRLKLRADESDGGEDEDEDRPPVATLQEESQARGKQGVSIDSKAEDAKEERLKSLRSRRSHTNKSADDGMDLDDD